MEKSTLLLTGFAPFSKWDTNPSWEIARRLDGQVIGGLQIVARELPVNWNGTWPLLKSAIEEIKPRHVLLLGLAGTRLKISVESQGCNTCGTSPDNEGTLVGTSFVEENGPDSLPSTLPVASMVRCIEQAGLPVEQSSSAGGYLCNHTLYKALLWASKQPEPPDVGFIHVPPLRGMNPDFEGLDLESMVKAIYAAIEAIAGATVEERELATYSANQEKR
ncbi:MAG: pyroglutamyl-peptidase I [Chloroflexota bacterium]|nr:pyroglutamyl-peptidase I [Chloroflexota bacterium]